MRLGFRLAAAFVAALAVATPASATVVVVPTLEEMTWRSDVIVHALVVDQEVVEQKPGRVVTRTFMQVEDGLSGASKAEIIVVEQLGGELGTYRAWIAGAHRFKVGDEVMFFGTRIDNAIGQSVVVPYGVGFGIFDIKDDVDGRHAVERGGDVSQLVRLPDGTTSMKPVEPRHYTSLDAFKQQLRDILDGRALAAPAAQKKILNPAPRRPAARAPSSTKE